MRVRSVCCLSQCALRPRDAPRALLRALCFTALTAAAAGAGYVLWKRSQPIEDPWAEDYWADLEVEDYSADQNQEASAE